MNKVQILEQLRQERQSYNKSWINPYTEVGDFTYADHPRIWTWNNKTKLHIGKFCSIGANVQFLLGGEHHTEWCTTYPFNVLVSNICPNEETTAASRGDIWIGNDVWIGNNVTILSGVIIGDGAVIANGAIVTTSVRPFTIVGGVPAKPIKQRFQANAIAELQWWNWPLEKLAEALPLLCSKDYDALINFDNHWQKDYINYIIIHKDYPIEEDNLYKALCVGTYQKTGYLSERNTNNNITDYNDRINELTGLYWIWKNSTASYVGLSHYKRYFNDSGKRVEKDKLISIMNDYNIILSEPCKLDYTIHDNIIKTVGNNLDIIAYAAIITMIEKYQPEYLKSFQEVLDSNQMYVCNMFFTKKEILDKYAEWLFSFILKATDNINLSHITGLQRRVMGYYGEIMWTVWLKKQQYKIYTLPIMNI